MFGGKKNTPTANKHPVPLDKAEIKAFLGPGSRFEGKLSFDEMVRLDGRFTGEIVSTDTLVVGESAEIEGSIEVGALILSGRFKGKIIATSLVELRAPAEVEGSIATPRLKIEDKVVFNGDVKMSLPPAAEAAGKPATPKA